MDVAAMLREAISGLPEGEHTVGLRAVTRHIDAAIGHYQRAKNTEDDDAFTDSIYRTNQAYEGSLKEAYRALYKEEPGKKSLFDIENRLQENNGLRERVIQQMKRYREDYRNPSTHNYKLDFDENESLLAIFTVGGFAKLLVDQIASTIEIDATKTDIAQENLPVEATTGYTPKAFFDSLTENLLSFLNKASAEYITQRENLSLITAYLSSSETPYALNKRIEYEGCTLFWDLVVEAPEGILIAFDVKTSRGRQSPEITEDRVARLAESLRYSGLSYGVLVEGAARGESYVLDDFNVDGDKVRRLGRKVF
jgi:hypothetical protein